MDPALILVYILAAFLALFLLLAIILTILLINVTLKIRDVTETAQRTAHGFERTVSNIRNVTTPAGIMKLASSIVKRRKK